MIRSPLCSAVRCDSQLFPGFTFFLGSSVGCDNVSLHIITAIFRSGANNVTEDWKLVNMGVITAEFDILWSSSTEFHQLKQSCDILKSWLLQVIGSLFKQTSIFKYVTLNFEKLNSAFSHFDAFLWTKWSAQMIRSVLSLKLLYPPLPLLTFSVRSVSQQHIPLSDILLFIALLKCLHIDPCPQNASMCVCACVGWLLIGLCLKSNQVH